MTTSPVTGQKVLVMQVEQQNEIVTRDVGKCNPERVQLFGEEGNCYNYVTLENYGNRSLIELKRRKRIK